jgi:hypothetical protein
MNNSRLTKIRARASARFDVVAPIDFRLTIGQQKLNRREQPFQIPVKFFEPTISPVKVSVTNPPPKS